MKGCQFVCFAAKLQKFSIFFHWLALNNSFSSTCNTGRNDNCNGMNQESKCILSSEICSYNHAFKICFMKIYKYIASLPIIVSVLNLYH